MSATTITRPQSVGPEPGPADDAAKRSTAYRTKVDVIRRRYERQALLNGLCANGLSLLLVAAGAAIGLAALAGDLSGELTALLGVAIILLEGVSRVVRPALRAGRARRGRADPGQGAGGGGTRGVRSTSPTPRSRAPPA